MHRLFQLLDSPSFYSHQMFFLACFLYFFSSNFSNQQKEEFDNKFFGNMSFHLFQYTKCTHKKKTKNTWKITPFYAHFFPNGSSFFLRKIKLTLETVPKPNRKQNTKRTWNKRETFVQLKITICSETVKLSPFSDIPLNQIPYIAYKWCVVIRIFFLFVVDVAVVVIRCHLMLIIAVPISFSLTLYRFCSI